MTPKPRILVAEDSATNRILIARMLQAYGCVVTLLASGEEAVDVLAGAGADGFDIVLMDIEMPDMNGEDATRLIRAQEADSLDRGRVPIIALTASDRPDQIERYLAAGMDAHVPKPIDWPKLFATIKALTATR